MITKDNLVDMLNKSLTNEDGFIEQYGKSFLEGIKTCNELTADKKQELKNLFKAILKDTKRHGKINFQLIKKIEKGGQNEY